MRERRTTAAAKAASWAMAIAVLGVALPERALAAPGTRYRHPAGFTFRYPTGWSATDQEGLIVLVPPRARGETAAPTDLYALGTESVAGQGIERPDDPRLIGSVERQILRLSRALQRAGKVQRLAIPRGQGVAGDAAAVLDFAATGRAGQSVWARAYVCVVGETSVALLGFGLREQVTARDAALRGIITTVAADARAAAPPPPARAPAAPAAPAAAVPAADLGDDLWGFRVRAPAGWRSRQQGEVALLGHDTIPGLVIVRPHEEKGLAAVRALMQRGLSEEAIRIAPAGPIRPAGKGGLVAEYTGTAQGQPVRARIVGLASPHGGGAWIFAVTTPPQFGRGLTDAADALARGIRWVKPSTTPLMKHFAGTWSTASASSSRRVTLGADGRYYSSSESYYGGRFSNSQGDWTGSWGTGGQSKAAGRWRVQGDQRAGMLVITLNNGSTEQLRYQVHVEKGKTYWREYKLNGVHYAKQ